MRYVPEEKKKQKYENHCWLSKYTKLLKKTEEKPNVSLHSSFKGGAFTNAKLITWHSKIRINFHDTEIQFHKKVHTSSIFKIENRKNNWKLK